MPNLQYSTDLKAYALDNADEPTDGSSEFDSQAELALNRRYQALWLGGQGIDPSIDENWWWLRKLGPGAFKLLPSIQEGTVKVVNGAPTITFSFSPTANLTGCWFRVTGQPDTFRIRSHNALQTNATLDMDYTGPDEDAASYRVIYV